MGATAAPAPPAAAAFSGSGDARSRRSAPRVCSPDVLLWRPPPQPVLAGRLWPSCAETRRGWAAAGVCARLAVRLSPTIRSESVYCDRGWAQTCGASWPPSERAMCVEPAGVALCHRACQQHVIHGESTACYTGRVSSSMIGYIGSHRHDCSLWTHLYRNA
jgi:hypothetical protein